MNFLQLSQRLRQETGGSGTGPSTTAGQSGENQRYIDWINTSYLELQSANEKWGWMRTSITFQTVAGQASYPLGTGAGTVGIPVANLGLWDRDTFRNYLTSAGTNGEMFMDCIDYDQWRDAYIFSAMRQTTTRPVAVAIGPDFSLNLGPPPIVGYTIEADYFLAPYLMVADTDTPALPLQYHMIIVYGAMMAYAGYEAASEVYQRGLAGYNRLMRQMLANRTPEIRVGRALA